MRIFYSLIPRPLQDFTLQLWRKQLQGKILEWPGNEARYPTDCELVLLVRVSLVPMHLTEVWYALAANY